MRRGRQIRSFFVILGITVLVWMAMAMSEKKEYSLSVKLRMTGVDLKRYAVLNADTVMTLQVESTGFNALILSLKKEPPTFLLDIRNEAVHHYSRRRGDVEDLYHTVALTDLSSLLSDQFSSAGVRVIGSAKDSLLLVLNERGHKVFRPDLSNLKINFSDGYGLYGEPLVSPFEITLYGSPEVLAAIERVGVKAEVLNDVRETATYRVAIDDSWKSLGDVYASDEMLTINIPVNRYVERNYVVPVTVATPDTSHHLRLYPDRVTLHVWVAQEDVASIAADSFVVTADYDDILSGKKNLEPFVSRFPRNVRIRNVEPKEIEYVIIK